MRHQDTAAIAITQVALGGGLGRAANAGGGETWLDSGLPLWVCNARATESKLKDTLGPEQLGGWSECFLGWGAGCRANPG